MWGMWRAAWRDEHWPTCQLLLLLQIPLIPDGGRVQYSSCRHRHGDKMGQEEQEEQEETNRSDVLARNQWTGGEEAVGQINHCCPTSKATR